MTVKIKGLDAIIKKLDSLGKPGVLRTPMKKSLFHVQRRIAKTPTGNQHRPQPFKTDKSRRWFFWALKKGLIEVPYRRGQSPGSEKLTTSWLSQAAMKISANGQRGELGNDASYGPLVQDVKRQTAYHRKTGWVTTQGVLKESTPAIVGYFKRTYDTELAK